MAGQACRNASENRFGHHPRAFDRLQVAVEAVDQDREEHDEKKPQSEAAKKA